MIPKAKRMTKLKKQCHEAWSRVVRLRDGECIRCGATKSLAAHHWIVSASRSLQDRYNPINGCALCYGCHIHIVHKEATFSHAIDIYTKMIKRLTVDSIGAVIDRAKKPSKKFTEEQLEGIRDELHDMYHEMGGTK